MILNLIRKLSSQTFVPKIERSNWCEQSLLTDWHMGVFWEVEIQTKHLKRYLFWTSFDTKCKR